MSVLLAERNHVVRALAPDRPDNALRGAQVTFSFDMRSIRRTSVMSIGGLPGFASDFFLR